MPFDKTNTGTLSKNDRMRPDSRDPEYTGSLNVDGVEYWVSAWVKTAGPNAQKPGAKFFSLALNPKDKPKAKPAPKAAAPADDFQDDEALPF